jgi:hypothetical protein
VNIDVEDLYKRFAYAVGQAAQSTEHYRALVNAIYDTLVLGPSEEVVKSLISAMFGISTCRNDGEVVEEVLSETGALQIITDQEVYTFPSSSTSLVSEGDTLERFQSLVNTVRFVYGAENILNELNALSLGSEFIGLNLSSELLFENKTVTISAQTETAVFEVSGRVSDLNTFWAEVTSRSSAASTSLRTLLGGAGASVNPLEIALTLLDRAIFVVVVDMNTVNGVFPISDIAGLLPPEIAFIIINETSCEDTITADNTQNDIEEYECPSPLQDTVIPTNLSNNVTIKGVPE